MLPHDLTLALIVAAITMAASAVRTLGVIAGEVVDAADRWPAPERGVSAVMVIPMNPGLQGTVAGGVGAVRPPIGPLLQQGAVDRSTLPFVCGR